MVCSRLHLKFLFRFLSYLITITYLTHNLLLYQGLSVFCKLTCSEWKVKGDWLDLIRQFLPFQVVKQYMFRQCWKEWSRFIKVTWHKLKYLLSLLLSSCWAFRNLKRKGLGFYNLISLQCRIIDQCTPTFSFQLNF